MQSKVGPFGSPYLIAMPVEGWFKKETFFPRQKMSAGTLGM